MRDYQSFRSLCYIWFFIIMALWLTGCESQSPLAPTVVTHTADIDPPLRNPNTPTVGNFPDWVCGAKFVRDPGPEFWAECKRRGL